MDEEMKVFSVNRKSVNLLIILVTAATFFILQFLEKSQTQGTFYGHTTQFLLEHGALYGPNVRAGEWYRLVTYLFLHGDISHLGHNMLILFFLGNVLERYFGKIRYIIVYFFSGILAAIGSIVYNTTETVCVGASGAVFGVIGATLWLVIKNKGNLTEFTKEQMIIFLVLSVFAGFGNYGVDNAAHIAGLIAGFFLGMLLYWKTEDKIES